MDPCDLRYSGSIVVIWREAGGKLRARFHLNELVVYNVVVSDRSAKHGHVRTASTRWTESYAVKLVATRNT